METIIAYFENGLLTKILPNEHANHYNSRYIFSDGVMFDLENTTDIENIPIPTFEATHTFPDISKSLDYVLKRKASDLTNRGLIEPAFSCLRKANQLMSYSPIHWNKKDYFYIVLELTRVGRYAEARKEKEFIENHYFEKYDFHILHKKNIQILLKNAHDLGTDLVEADNPPNCSELCAKYRKRIYSLTGKDSRFPIMTDVILNSGLLFYPFIYGISQPKYCNNEEILSYNNRPYIDDRTDEEKANYDFFNKQRVLKDRKATDFLEYSQICNSLSAFKPKSFKAYQEMKFEYNDAFQELLRLSEEVGICIEL